MDLTYRDNYWNDHEAKAEFNRFLNEIHGLDLTRWGEFGYWDRQYRPFSFFDEDRIIASLCVYSMDMTIDGKRKKVAQISGVGTAEEYRRKGLNSELTRIALEWARPRHEFFFLFADEDARMFYKAGGFREVREHRVSIAAPRVSLRSGTRHLDIEDDADRKLIENLARVRAPVSNLLGVHNFKLFMFWCLYFLKDNLYYIDKLDTLMACSRDQDKLIVHDVVAREVPRFDAIYPYIGAATDQIVEFRFMVDKMDLDETDLTLTEIDLGTHLMGIVLFESRPFQFPCTAHA